jgi:hypothetical protein
MNMVHKIYILLFFAFFYTACINAQQSFDTSENIYEESKGIVYDREFTVDMKLHTNGYALGVNIARLKTYYLTRFFNIEIGEIKHPKEFRQSFDFQAQSSKVSRAFVFGKQNNLLVLRGGLGEKRYFSEKARRKGLAVGVSYEGGASLGLLKPYYLELLRPVDSDVPNGEFVIRSEKYSPNNADTFLEINRIYGSSGFSKGLGEISVIPGLHGKAAVHFDWGAFDEFVKAMEAGIMVDVFFQEVPIMVESPLVQDSENSPFFINLYLNLQLGKRW